MQIEQTVIPRMDPDAGYSLWPSISARHTKRNQISATGLAADAIVALQSYLFLGNVRELEHLIERAAVNAEGGLSRPNRFNRNDKVKDPTPGAFDTQTAIGMPFHEAVASWERSLIERALKAWGGNKSDAARRLRIHRRLLYEKLAQFVVLSLTQLEDFLKRFQNVSALSTGQLS